MEIIKWEKDKGPEAEKLWRERIEKTIEHRKTAPFGDVVMDRSRRLFVGRHWGVDPDVDIMSIDLSSQDPANEITVNVTGSTVQDFIPFLVRTKPRFELIPKKDANLADAAKRASAYMNYAWTEFGMQKQYRRVAQDGLVYGKGIIKTGYRFELEEAEPREPGDDRVAYNDSIRWDAPHMQRINPKRFYSEPGAPGFDVESARWAFEVMFQRLQDVVENPSYSKAVRGKLKSGRETAQTVSDFLSKKGEDIMSEDKKLEADISTSQQLIVLVEVWDKKYNKVWLFAMGVDKPLMEEKNPYPYLDGLPYLEWRYQEINDEVNGLGVPEVMRDQQLELNRVRSAEFKHIREFGARKYAIADDGVDEQELEKLLDGQSAYVKERIPGNLRVLANPPLPQDLYRVDGVIMNDIRLLTGQDALQQGGALPSRTSAREVQARVGNAGIKTAGRTALLDELTDAVGRQIVQHIRANMETKQVVRVTGDRGDYSWLTISPEDIKGEYDLEFESTSRSEEPPEVERANRANIFERAVAAAPFMAQQGMQVNLAELFKWSLEPYQKTVELDRFFIAVEPPPPDDTGGASSSSEASTNPAKASIHRQGVNVGSQGG